jgi:hypothetical protein
MERIPGVAGGRSRMIAPGADVAAEERFTKDAAFDRTVAPGRALTVDEALLAARAVG